MGFIKGVFGAKKQDISLSGNIYCISRNGSLALGTGTIVLVVTDVPSGEFVGIQLYSKVVDMQRGFYAAEPNPLPIDKLKSLIEKDNVKVMTWEELSKL